MTIAGSVRRLVAGLIASNRYTRVLFKRIALDEVLLPLILKDPLFAPRVNNIPAAKKILDSLAPANTITEPTQATGVQNPSSSVHEPMTDISVGVDWGPSAFPMTRHALYFPQGMGILAERWLRRLPLDACVLILADKAEFETAKSYASSYRQIKYVIELPATLQQIETDAGIRKELASFRALDAVVLPVSTGCKDLAFLPGNMLPDLDPLYPRFRMFWRLGFRQFALYSFHGLRQMEVPFLLDDFAGRHTDQRCFILGSGPSLRHLDITQLKDEITFGSNSCHQEFQRWGFSCNYWTCTAPFQLEAQGLKHQDHLPESVVKFVPFSYLPLLQLPNCCPVNMSDDTVYGPGFSDSPDSLCPGPTSMVTLLQLAVIMKCNPIYLVGVDHRWNPDAWEVLHHTIANKELELWASRDAGAYLRTPPDLARMEAAYEEARRRTEEIGVKIWNATPHSGLSVFDKIDYERLF